MQAAFAQLGDGHGLAEGGGAVGVGYAVFSGTDPERGPYVNQLVGGNNGGPGSPTADGWITYAMPGCADCLRRQLRGPRAEVPDARTAAGC